MNTMKKTLLYSLAAMASLALASCAGDYDDWANPQANEQEASAAKYGVTFANGSEAEGSMADEDGIINLVTVNSTDANVSGFTLQDFKVNGVAVNGTMVGNSVQVSASELEKLVCEQNKSRASVARDLKVETQVSINLASGDAVSITTKGETTGKFTPTATPQLDEKGYYMLGQVNGNEWDAKSPVWMNKISDGVYQLKVTTTADKNWFKFYAGSNFVSEDWDSINKGALGCKENGSEDTFGYILYDGDSWGELQTPVIPGAGTWIVTLDMNNLTYTVGKPVLYMAGDANGWATNDYLAGEDGVHFTGFMYLNQNGFKFCTQPEWKGTNYGADFNTAADAANITMTEEAGYYKVDVDLESKSYVLTPITTIGIIGSASPNGWDSDVDMTYVPYNAETKALGYWEAKDITLASGEIKFRANDDWAINWGGDVNALTQGGGNISVDAGTYDIKLYAWANGYAKCVMTKK
ncbi:Outer membrane protein SusF domain-containing protein [Prevotella sp. LCP21S3_D2]|uniref:Outer membrane protein SusF domain-containing protein n=1 Tax=Prevotella sp. LCP21S3_D2 TaxID=3438800 RepID=UPI003F97A22F